ncbi:Transcription elongation factor, GreA/GreB, C-term [Prosthecobacter debontii]|uniref:Transcription elongation factor, GreA/GreB, C-term n=1 Tax=Prosthecobacter debontii TaxID=48467 RepID=A0A1T4YDX4_9BACT|nr:GreA/GreB family elongation factor [Prosthecobacter debontii]SKB00022.1 Transcription elongation factor, GreA/GreB, C-term [Prosthecobacter debontii]
MNKTAVVSAIVEALGQELAALTRGARASFAAATDPDSRAENKYDTRTLEASYVARGQAQRVAELQEAVHQFQVLSRQPPAVMDRVGLGSLVTLDGQHLHFIGPGAGGTEIQVEGQEILLITPASPLGQKLMGKKAGDHVEVRPGLTFQVSAIL